MSTQYVVIGTSPTVDTSIVCGPYRSYDRASETSDEMTARGYVTEVAPLERIEDVPASPAWDGQGIDERV